MGMKRIALTVLGLLPAGCGLIKPKSQDATASNALTITFNKTGDPFGATVPVLTLPGMPPGGAPAAQENTAGATADPLLDFSSAFSRGPARSRTMDWRRSGSEAAVEARRSGRPFLILLTDEHIPAATSLQTMLAAQPDTGTLIETEFVPLLVDFGDKDTRDSLYYRALRDRYKPRGFPVLIAALPDGTEITRQTGYSTDAQTGPEWKRRTLQWVKAAAAQSGKTAAARRKRLEATGYREWSSKSGAPVFAKLVKVDANQAIFISEWGETFRTFVSRLAESEQARLVPGQDAAHQGNPPGGPDT
jgi:hypothetical protein